MVLMTPYYIETNPARPHARDRWINTALIVRSVAEKHGTLFVDTQKAFDAVLAHLHPMTLAWDRIHPTLGGHMIIAQAFLARRRFRLPVCLSPHLLPRPEYPRPQFVRRRLALPQRRVGIRDRPRRQRPRTQGPREARARRPHHRAVLARSRRSRASTSPISWPPLWYRRTVTIPPAWRGRNILLHFGAVDYDATVWVNGRQVGRHRGGFTPFTLPLKASSRAGQEAVIVVRARDTAQGPKPRGKQSLAYDNAGCHYVPHDRHLANGLDGTRPRRLFAPHAYHSGCG